MAYTFLVCVFLFETNCNVRFSNTKNDAVSLVIRGMAQGVLEFSLGFWHIYQW